MTRKIFDMGRSMGGGLPLFDLIVPPNTAPMDLEGIDALNGVLDDMQKEMHNPRFAVYVPPHYGKERQNQIFYGIGDGTGPVLEPATGVELKAEGMTRAMKKAASKLYRGRLEDALLRFGVGAKITVEQLTGIAGRPELWGATHYCVGPIINGMAKRGLIEKTGRMVQAQRPGMHATELAEWRICKYANTISS